jgi:predicted SAM-dependent methyltransferase
VALGFGIRVRLIRAWRSAVRKYRQRARRPIRRIRVQNLHIGSGPAVLPGWTNVDLEYHPGLDHVLDVRFGLPFQDASYIYAEHFIEHLNHDEAMRFLSECRAALNAAGVLRLSTPNLDWVWCTQYHRPADDPIRDCFAINKSFRGWGHQFLYNVETLSAALRDAGFAEVRVCRYGESEHAQLHNLERHEKSIETPELPHVIILEASGSRSRTDHLKAISEDYGWALEP